MIRLIAVVLSCVAVALAILALTVDPRERGFHKAWEEQSPHQKAMTCDYFTYNREASLTSFVRSSGWNREFVTQLFEDVC